MIHALLCYTCKIFLKITHQTALREVQPNTALFFSDVGLTKFVIASELFVPRPYFICHYLTAKRFTKDLMARNLFFKEGSQKWNQSGKFEIAHVYCEF